MGWVKRKVDQHTCNTPSLDETPDAYPGDVWECDVCGVHWKVHEQQFDGLYWQLTPRPRGHGRS